MMQKFGHRKDKMIMGSEILAVMLGLETFKEQIDGKLLRIWTDNAGGEHVLRQGSSKTNDYNALVHLFWLKCAQLSIEVEARRRPTKDNIADGPTRPTKSVNCKILTEMQALEIKPKLPSELIGAVAFKDCLV